MQTNIENFYRTVVQNPALLNKITTGASTPDEVIDRAVAVAKDEGYTIDRQEASTWIESQIAARQRGELTDVQLESVAGGKGGMEALGVMGTIAAGTSSAFSGMVNPLMGAVASPQFKPVAEGLTSAQQWLSKW